MVSNRSGLTVWWGCVRVVFCRPYYTLRSLMVSRNLSKRREPGALQSAMIRCRFCFFQTILLCLRSQAKNCRMWHLLEEYCKKWRFEVNVDKSKVMVCGTKFGLNTEE